MNRPMDEIIDNMVANPHRHFSNPVEVLQSPELTNDEKRRILESWKLDAQRLAESTAENMSGGEESDLREVSKSLVQLNTMDAVPPKVVQSSVRPRGNMALGLSVGAIVGAGVGLVVITAWPPLHPVFVVAEAIIVGVLAGGVTAALRRAVRP